MYSYCYFTYSIIFNLLLFTLPLMEVEINICYKITDKELFRNEFSHTGSDLHAQAGAEHRASRISGFSSLFLGSCCKYR